MSCAIVTGADSGIGKATAVALAARGYDVGITYHEDEAGARETVSEIESHGRRGVARPLELRRPASAAGLVDELADELGGLDAFVNNAGGGPITPFLEIDLDEWGSVLDVNLTGAFVAGQAAARRMVRGGRGGRIVNVTSVHEHVPMRGAAHYSAAKGGLGLLTRVMALELAPHGITVNAVAPGEIATPLTGAADVDPATQERPKIPLRRPGDAREVAATIAFLAAEPEARYTTGASYVVDGGLLLMAAVANQDANTGS